ncbi:uncharacterized mitochondrial protein AtMg01250-like [Rutidosis leptorrhynchoides]|uniref:uncharacterized mitochondrial protein AtMg01250-like n=1 Tax=Rutidosis leptorrhynchoides TaxID=125765 RepID=UPI003A99DCD5
MEAMEFMGFGLKWRKWILSYLKSASFSVLVNDSPTNEFKLQRDVRQGDPLSPFLFIIAAEGLNALAKAAVKYNMFLGDDTIFSGNWSKENICNLMKLLKCFELTSGLKVNYQKSNLFWIGVEKNEVEMMANSYG